ncbi:MAG: substrate-binding domain-containing protein [Oscillospiraceae bacterium]|nr:substrate-binding domain-containing protein [Oscillospiraceae bacterium]
MTIKDIAKAAGVSPSTVSLIINQKDARISEETRRRVMQVIEESNYIPYAGVRGRLLAQNNQIALVMPSLKDPFLAEFADRVQSLARSRGYALTVQSSAGPAGNEEMILSELSEAYIAGLFFFPQSEQGISFLSSEDSNIGCAVLLDSTFPGLPFPQLSRDFAAAAETGAAYLLSNNHRRIALVLKPEISDSIREKVISGYKAALSSAKAPFDEQLIVSAAQDADSVLGSLIDAGIDAVICQDSASVGETYRILARKQYKIPEDISVLCLEDSPLMQQLVPAVTSVRTGADEMAKLAIDTLISQLSAGQTAPFVTNLPVQLIRRNSVRKHAKPEHKIVIAGSINMDVTLNVSRLPHTGETVLASGQSSWPGGKGANQAIGVSRFGADAFMVGRLGNDVYGKQLFERLSNEQVDMQGVSFSQDLLSGTAFINVQSDGQNTIVVNPGANASVTPEYIAKNRYIFNDAHYCLIQMEIPLETVEAIVQLCKELNVKVILKPSPAQALPSDVLKDLFLLIPNQEEADELFPNLSSPDAQAQAILGQGVENVIITLGDKGCLFADQAGSRVYPAVDFPSVDATGASDIFISCLAAQLSKGKDMDSSIKLATIAASYSVSKEGVQNAIISSDLLFDLYNGDYSLSATVK